MRYRISLRTKIIAFVLPAIVIAGGLIYLQCRSNRLTEEFYKMQVNSFIINLSDWQKRSIDFYLDNGVVLNFLAPANDKLQIGDSIEKPKCTFKYKVYRKTEDGNFKLISTYDYRKGH